MTTASAYDRASHAEPQGFYHSFPALVWQTNQFFVAILGHVLCQTSNKEHPRKKRIFRLSRRQI
jgi:hypothetical protein